jgi:hypothetical protein
MDRPASEDGVLLPESFLPDAHSRQLRNAFASG